MKGMILRKAFLIGCIFLVSTFMSAQLSWGCDDNDKDKWDCDHHDKWDCHKYGKPCQPPKIQSVDVDLDRKEIIIHGENFDNGATPPVATLGGNIELEIDTYTGSEIVAKLPAPQYIPDSDYRLVVSTCRDSECNDKHCKDHGPNCKCKYCKDHCSKFKNKDCKGNEYKCRCKDRYSLTIPGPSGTPPPPGTIESAVFEKVGDVGYINDIPKTISGTATCGEGYTITGGGFKSVNLKIIESRPEGNGWYVSGRIAPETELEPTLTIYAVCAKIK